MPYFIIFLTRPPFMLIMDLWMFAAITLALKYSDYKSMALREAAQVVQQTLKLLSYFYLRCPWNLWGNPNTCKVSREYCNRNLHRKTAVHPAVLLWCYASNPNNVGTRLVWWDPIVRSFCFLIEYLGVCGGLYCEKFFFWSIFLRRKNWFKKKTS